MLFNTLADSSGHISFVTENQQRWTAFQIQQSAPPAPPTSATPGPLPILGAAAAFGSVGKLRRLSSALKQG